MTKPRKLRPVTLEGPWRFVPVEEWAERHHHAGHQRQPTPTNENPERWDCDCGGLWRILTPEQVRQKFAHVKPGPRRVISLAGELRRWSKTCAPPVRLPLARPYTSPISSSPQGHHLVVKNDRSPRRTASESFGAVPQGSLAGRPQRKTDEIG